MFIDEKLIPLGKVLAMEENRISSTQRIEIYENCRTSLKARIDLYARCYINGFSFI